MSKSAEISDRNDIFIGNLPYSATEEQLLETFAIVGPIKKIRMLNDKDTGRPKGFAFIEYYEPMVALAAIKHLNNTELGGKQLRVGFASNSSLKDRAIALGQDIDAAGGSNSTQSVVSALPLHEAWDILDSVKSLVETDRNLAKNLLESYPQLVFALVEIQNRLGITNTAALMPVNQQQQPQQQQHLQQQNYASNIQPSAQISVPSQNFPYPSYPDPNTSQFPMEFIVPSAEFLEQQMYNQQAMNYTAPYSHYQPPQQQNW